jgi:hypothetical protein
VLCLFEDEARLKILHHLYHVLYLDKNDKALSLLTSMYFKECFDRAAEKQVAYITYARESLFEMCLNCLKDEYILELTERIQAALSLYIYMSMRETVLLK